ncbi:hypothetical protein GCM10011492_08590 [Flexivirga endophytica]|uniref:SH3 domain-containing protein n=1 Tax=Flexivirga endophytica TaxID=1849103 RepID=A0A916SXF4_9MICO|nr:hypothetical protein GCM10011492_08590 [Flexivirga endophytica]GHB58730.1 hypothetical protein GCM10008112_29610 [Flexivirga endophytica]
MASLKGFGTYAALVKAAHLGLLGTLTIASLTLAGCNAGQDAAVTTPTRTVVQTVTSTSVVTAPTARSTSTHRPAATRTASRTAATSKATATSTSTSRRAAQPPAAPRATSAPRSTTTAPPVAVQPAPRHTTTRAPVPLKATTTTGACNIKGNISSSGEKIYHVPGQRYYDVTKISLGKGERWFCSESDAVAAGWRPAKV